MMFIFLVLSRSPRQCPIYSSQLPCELHTIIVPHLTDEEAGGWVTELFIGQDLDLSVLTTYINQ